MEDMRLSTLFERLAIGVGMGSFRHINTFYWLLDGWHVTSLIWFCSWWIFKQSSEDSHRFIGYQIWLPCQATTPLAWNIWRTETLGLGRIRRVEQHHQPERGRKPAGQQHRSLLQVFREGGSPHRPCKSVESLANCSQRLRLQIPYPP